MRCNHVYQPLGSHGITGYLQTIEISVSGENGYFGGGGGTDTKALYSSEVLHLTWLHPKIFRSF